MNCLVDHQSLRLKASSTLQILENQIIEGKKFFVRIPILLFYVLIVIVIFCHHSLSYFGAVCADSFITERRKKKSEISNVFLPLFVRCLSGRSNENPIIL